MTPEETIEEFKKFLKTLSPEDRRRIFYVLDYINNYFIGDRRGPALKEIGFYKELSILKEHGIVKEEKLSWRGRTYDHFSINQEIKESIEKLLEEEYYPLITEDYVRKKILEAIKEYKTEAMEFWSNVVDFDSIEYTLSSWYDTRNHRLVGLGIKLSQNEIGYLINYWTSSAWNLHKYFIFRKYPIDSRKIFIEVVEEEINRIFSSFTPAMRWCLYLEYLVPDADEGFILNNSTIRFLPNEIKEAFGSLPSIKIEKTQDILSSLLEKERERISKILKLILYRDQDFISVLQMLIVLGDKKERYIEVTKYQIDKIKDISPGLEDLISRYIEYMKNLGIILESNHGNLLIPNIVKEVLTAELKGSTEVKIFESPIDAQAFIEEEMARATNSIKIWDPYVSTKTLRIIERIAKESIKIEILSSLPNIADEIITLVRRGFDIEATIVYEKKGTRYLSPFHDRYLIIDDKIVWHFGPSLHGAGEKEYETAVRLPESSSKIFIDAFKYNFLKKEENWEKEGYKVVKIPKRR